MKIISTVVLASLFIETVANLSDGVPVSPAKAFDNRSLQQKRYMTGIRETIDHSSDYDFSVCSGALISQSHVLTTMTCISAWNAKFVSVGAIFYISGANDGEEIKVVSVAKHPHFNEETLSNNFAVLKLARNVKATIRPVKLPTESSSKFRTGKVATAMGWCFAYEEMSSMELLKLDQKLISDKDCRKEFNLTTIDTFMCAGREKDKSTCDIDGGGSLIFENGKGDKDDVLIGLISRGIDTDCVTEGCPTLYSRVSSALEWINTVMEA